jgi:hypothetical protein
MKKTIFGKLGLMRMVLLATIIPMFVGCSKTGMTPTSANTSVSNTKVSTDAVSNAVTATAGGAWVNTSFASQMSDFTVNFNASVSASPTNAIIAFSNGAQTAYADFATLVRFNPTGDIDAYNGTAYVSPVTAIPYTLGTNYNFVVAVHMNTQTYDISVSNGAGAAQVIGTGFKFRASVTSLNNYGAYVSTDGGSGTLTVSNFTILAATPTFTPTPIAWRVVSGGPAHTDCQGNLWLADENYSGGTAATSTNTIASAMPCSTDGALYQDQRYGTFTYTFNEPAGNYQVTLKFAETYFTAVGDREFNVSINGMTELTNFDIFKTAGGQNKAVDEVFNNIASSGGEIMISFGPAAVNNAMIDSIQIISQSAAVIPTSTNTFTATAVLPTATYTNTFTVTSTPTLTATATLTPTFTSTFTATSTHTYTSTYTPTATPNGFSIWRVVAGGPAYTDCQGNVWAADENYVGGTAATSTDTITGALPCSTNSALYQDQRYGAFSYVFNVPAGSYQVDLKFAETYFTAAGDREFNVSVNGNTVLTNFDIFAAAGGANIAVDRMFNNIASTGGAITITFGPAAVNNALVSAIQIVPQSQALPTETPTKTPVPPTKTPTPQPLSINFSQWYLQEPSGSGTNPTTIPNTELESGYSDTYFYKAADGWQAYMDTQTGITTSGSAHPRCEMHEESTWGTGGTNTLTVMGKATLIDGDTTTVGQIFNNNEGTLVELQYSKSLGGFKVFYEEVKGSGSYPTQTTAYVAMNTAYTYQLALNNGVAKVTINGQVVFTHTLSSTVSGDQFYFKAGNYDQSATAGSVSTTPYSIIEIGSAVIVHE